MGQSATAAVVHLNSKTLITHRIPGEKLAGMLEIPNNKLK